MSKASGLKGCGLFSAFLKNKNKTSAWDTEAGHLKPQTGSVGAFSLTPIPLLPVLRMRGRSD